MRDLGLGRFIEGYNGKPALITKSGSIYRGDDYLEMDMNTFRFAYITRKVRPPTVQGRAGVGLRSANVQATCRR